MLHRDMRADEAGGLAELIVDALLAPVTLNGKEILAGGSVGVAMAPENGHLASFDMVLSCFLLVGIAVTEYGANSEAG